MVEYLFVYGTLKEGFPNHGLNRGRRLPGLYRTVLRYPLYVVRLAGEERAPWLVDAPGGGSRVVGQVFEVDAATMQAMDDFEETHLPTGYARVRVDLEPEASPGATLQASVYLKRPHQLADCLATEGPFAEYTPELAAGYRLCRPDPSGA